jgi:hypothetical protein
MIRNSSAHFVWIIIGILTNDAYFKTNLAGCTRT